MGAAGKGQEEGGVCSVLSDWDVIEIRIDNDSHNCGKATCGLSPSLLNLRFHYIQVLSSALQPCSSTPMEKPPYGEAARKVPSGAILHHAQQWRRLMRTTAMLKQAEASLASGEHG